MGAGKSTVGRRLASTISIPFIDADAEIERAAGETVNEIFENRGEEIFRMGERKVIARLLDGPRHVLATGGGAYMAPETRELISKRAISIWLKADLDLILERVSRRNTRPLLRNGDPKEILEQLIEERYPVYAQADIVVESQPGPHALTVKRILKAIDDFLEGIPGSASNI